MYRHSPPADSIAMHSNSAWQVFAIFLRLGLTSFGGPVAHLGYFRQEFVARRRWLDEAAYADLVALCQFLPGPASSQLGMALGLRQAGLAGALAAWLGFTLPSALVMTLLGLGLVAGQGLVPEGVLSGLKVAAVAVVAQAVWGMARNLCRGWHRLLLMAFACTLVLLQPGLAGQLGAMLLAALAGLALWGRRGAAPVSVQAVPAESAGARAAVGAFLLAVFAALLVLLPLAARSWPQPWLALADTFYRVGALVFGGGHVVLPLLQAEVVAPGWVALDDFLAGYGLAQALPGPLFSFAAFLGAAAGGWPQAVVCLVAIFLPAFLLVAGVLPFWERLRHNLRVRAALSGVNAAVVGVLLAALYDPVWTSAIHTPSDLLLALAVFVELMWGRMPPWLVVPLCGLMGLWL